MNSGMATHNKQACVAWKKTLSKITNASINDIKYDNNDDDDNNDNKNIPKQAMQMKSTLYESCFKPFVVCISVMWSVARKCKK